ncbi:MAG: hypothetical protein NTY96_10760 [Bacteroidetes bacterium]|nr:hypothetical protein [Bacteroidota bacterium]
MRFYFLVLLLHIFFIGPAFSQSPDWDRRLAFAENVRKIKFWAYIDHDSTYNCYADAVSAIQDALNKKGYDYERLFYFPKGILSLESWKVKQIKSLAAHEAYLEIRVSIRADSSSWANASTLMVQDASGRVYAQHTLKPEEVSTLEYTSTAEASLFIPKVPPDSASLSLFYSRKTSVPNPGIGSASTISLKGIPYSHNPVSRRKPAYLNKGGVASFEFVFYGGYCAGASIDITGGKATFKPGPDYGIEFNVNVYKGFDVAIGYKREDTFAEVTAPKYPREGELALSNNYILISGIYKFFHTKKLQPFVGFDFGGVNIVMKDKLFRDVWYFAVGGRAGLSWYVTKVLGFRLQTQLLYQVHPTDAPFLYSNDIATMNYSINANSSLPQFDATLGILIRLGK